MARGVESICETRRVIRNQSKQWPKQKTCLPPGSSPVASCTNCQRIYERSLVLTQRHKRHGKILRHSRAMNGSAGFSPQGNRRRGIVGSRGRARSSSKECAALVVGPVALIAKI